MAEKSCLPGKSRLVTKWQRLASLWHLSHMFTWCGGLIARRQWIIHGTIFNCSTLLTHGSQISDSKSTAISFICRLLNGKPMMHIRSVRKMRKRLTFVNDTAERGVKLATNFVDTTRSHKHLQNILQVVENDRQRNPNLRVKKYLMKYRHWYMYDNNVCSD